MKMLHIVAFTLMALGALNWGLVALLDFNLVSTLLGSWPMVEKAAYVLVGASAVYVFVTHRADCKVCSKK
ncbi:MAG: DUF378 domain-containing protein [Patescibacteria group bacterium]